MDPNELSSDLYLLIQKIENFNLSKVWKKIQSNRLKLDWKTLFQFAIRLKYVSSLERLIIISIFWKIDSLSQSYLSKFARAGQ
jgi:hypothetical protein